MKNYKIIGVIALAFTAFFGCNVDDDATPVASATNQINVGLRDTGVVVVDDPNAAMATNSIQTSEVLPFNSRVNYTVNGNAEEIFLNPNGTSSFDVDVPLVNGIGIMRLDDVRMNFEASSGNRARIAESRNSVAYVTSQDLFFELAWESNSDLDFRVSIPSNPVFFQSAAVTNPESVTFPLNLPENVYTVSITPFTATPSGIEPFSWTAVSPSSGLVTGGGTLEGALPSSGFFTIVYETVAPILEIERTDRKSVV